MSLGRPGFINTVTLPYPELAGFVLLGYDYCLTLSQEVERVWNQKLTGPVLLFLVNRYLGLVYQITCLSLSILQDTEIDAAIITVPIANPIENFKDVTAIILVTVCEMIMTIRVYALYGCNHILLGFLIMLIVAQLVLVMCFEFVSSVHFAVGGFSNTAEGSATNSFVLWISALIMDTIVFVLTLRKTHGYYKNSQRAPLLHLFLGTGWCTSLLSAPQTC